MTGNAAKGNALSYCGAAPSRRRGARPNAARARQGMKRGRERLWFTWRAVDVRFHVTPCGSAAILRIKLGRVCQ
ncbi:MAG: hypothetical protein FalmKO_01480 [Falsiruegeria mediterranea]